jgi:hypothetical protein
MAQTPTGSTLTDLVVQSFDTPTDDVLGRQPRPLEQAILKDKALRNTALELADMENTLNLGTLSGQALEDFSMRFQDKSMAFMDAVQEKSGLRMTAMGREIDSFITVGDEPTAGNVDLSLVERLAPIYAGQAAIIPNLGVDLSAKQDFAIKPLTF